MSFVLYNTVTYSKLLQCGNTLWLSYRCG